MEENRFTWNLEDIYPDEQAWYQDLSKAKELTAKLAAMQGKVCQDGHTLLEALDLSTKCSEYIAKLFTYASCHYDAQMGNAGYKKLYETICGENSAAAEQTSFLMPELMELTRESFDRLCAQVPELALYTHYIEDLLSQKEHILDERSEQMLVRMQDIHSSFKKIYTDLRVNDTKNEEIADSQGNKLVVSDATYSAAMEHPDRAFRKEFFEKLLGPYGGYINTLSSNYYALVKTNVYIAKSRGYCSARNQSLSENFIPEEVYDNLLATVRANTEPFQRYISLRNRVLGLDKSYMYDLFLPIVPDSTKKYSFDEAYELMLKATAILGEDYTALVKRSHEERWCDVYPKQGKVSGAYSTGVYDVHPYMLLNYNGTLDDVFTLLHETGHSMHSYYSDHTQPFIYSSSVQRLLPPPTRCCCIIICSTTRRPRKKKQFCFPSTSTTSAPPSTVRRCLLILKIRPTRWWKQVSRCCRMFCAKSIVRSMKITTDRTLLLTALSPTSGHASRTFTVPSMFTSMRPESPLPLRLPTASASWVSRLSRITKTSCVPVRATIQSSCSRLPVWTWHLHSRFWTSSKTLTRPSNSWKSCCKSEVQRTLEKAAPVPKRTPPFYAVGQGAVLLFCPCCDKMLRRKQAG